MAKLAHYNVAVMESDTGRKISVRIRPEGKYSAIFAFDANGKSLYAQLYMPRDFDDALMFADKCGEDLDIPDLGQIVRDTVEYDESDYPAWCVSELSN